MTYLIPMEIYVVLYLSWARQLQQVIKEGEPESLSSTDTEDDF